MNYLKVKTVEILFFTPMPNTQNAKTTVVRFQLHAPEVPKMNPWRSGYTFRGLLGVPGK